MNAAGATEEVDFKLNCLSTESDFEISFGNDFTFGHANATKIFRGSSCEKIGRAHV